MQIGFNLPLSGALASPPMLTRLAVEGEAIGFDYIALSDHIVEPLDIHARYPYSETGEFPKGSRGERHEQLAAMAYLFGVRSLTGLIDRFVGKSARGTQLGVVGARIKGGARRIAIQVDHVARVSRDHDRCAFLAREGVKLVDMKIGVRQRERRRREAGVDMRRHKRAGVRHVDQ